MEIHWIRFYSFDSVHALYNCICYSILTKIQCPTSVIIFGLPIVTLIFGGLPVCTCIVQCVLKKTTQISIVSEYEG